MGIVYCVMVVSATLFVTNSERPVGPRFRYTPRQQRSCPRQPQFQYIVLPTWYAPPPLYVAHNPGPHTLHSVTHTPPTHPVCPPTHHRQHPHTPKPSHNTRRCTSMQLAGSLVPELDGLGNGLRGARALGSRQRCPGLLAVAVPPGGSHLGMVFLLLCVCLCLSYPPLQEADFHKRNRFLTSSVSPLNALFFVPHPQKLYLACP